MKSKIFFDVMVDLETYHTCSSAAMLSIGAVAFTRPDHGLTPKLGAEFHEIVSLNSCLSHGLLQNDDTAAWWEKQSEAARETLYASRASSKPLKDSLTAFSTWLDQFDRSKLRVWGNGSDFDNVILNSAFATVKLPLPWKFYNNRCYRTMKSFYPSVEMQREGVYHNALADAKSQANHLLRILEKHNGR